MHSLGPVCYGYKLIGKVLAIGAKWVDDLVVMCRPEHVKDKHVFDQKSPMVEKRLTRQVDR